MQRLLHGGGEVCIGLKETMQKSEAERQAECYPNELTRVGLAK